jgi:hypothetical protein
MSFLTWKNQKSLSGFEPTAVRDKRFEVNDFKHSATDASHKIVMVLKYFYDFKNILKFINVILKNPINYYFFYTFLLFPWIYNKLTIRN